MPRRSPQRGGRAGWGHSAVEFRPTQSQGFVRWTATWRLRAAAAPAPSRSDRSAYPRRPGASVPGNPAARSPALGSVSAVQRYRHRRQAGNPRQGGPAPSGRQVQVPKIRHGVGHLRSAGQAAKLGHGSDRAAGGNVPQQARRSRRYADQAAPGHRPGRTAGRNQSRRAGRSQSRRAGRSQSRRAGRSQSRRAGRVHRRVGRAAPRHRPGKTTDRNQLRRAGRSQPRRAGRSQPRRADCSRRAGLAAPRRRPSRTAGRSQPRRAERSRRHTGSARQSRWLGCAADRSQRGQV